MTLPVGTEAGKVTALAGKNRQIVEKNERNEKTPTVLLVTKLLSDQSGDEFNSVFLNRHRSMKFN